MTKIIIELTDDAALNEIIDLTGEITTMLKDSRWKSITKRYRVDLNE